MAYPNTFFNNKNTKRFQRLLFHDKTRRAHNPMRLHSQDFSLSTDSRPHSSAALQQQEHSICSKGVR